MNLEMSKPSTTKMTSKGQVVIPEEIREFMELEVGSQFIVLAIGDSIVFKKIHPMPKKDIHDLLKASRKLAKECGFNEYDIEETIKEVRAEKRKKIKTSKQDKS